MDVHITSYLDKEKFSYNADCKVHSLTVRKKKSQLPFLLLVNQYIGTIFFLFLDIK